MTRALSDCTSDVQMVDRALPVIDAVISRRCRHWKLANDVREDMRSEVFVRLVKRLRDEESEPISRFEEYVAGVTSRVVDDVIRATSPEWTRLKYRVRYVLNHDDRFRVVAFADGRIVCSQQPPPVFGRRRVRTQDAIALAQTMMELLPRDAERTVDELVNELAQRSGVADPIRISGERIAASHAADAETAVVSTQTLARLWSEIVELPWRQRLALLLNARDAVGDSVLRLLVAEKIVTSRQLAAALEVRELELELLWGDLPLMDIAIAERLQVTRQQVINLRKSARDRLARRMARH
jgi:hypothetical protein